MTIRGFITTVVLVLACAAQLYAGCPDDSITITVRTDNWPNENSWELLNSSTGAVVAQSSGMNNANTTYTWKVCISSDSCYTFKIYDSFGDGMTAPAGFTLNYHGNNIASGNNFGAGQTVENLGACPCHGVKVELEIQLDNRASETTWFLHNQSTGQIIDWGLNYNNNNPQLIKQTYCLDSNECYYFRIVDNNNNGICCGFGNGYFRVYEDGVLVGTGSNFGGSAVVSGIGTSNCPPVPPPPNVIQTSSTKYTVNELVNEVLLGECITASNISYTGHNQAIGYYWNGSSMGMDTGVILTSGRVATASSTNNSGTAGTSNGNNGDATLNSEFGITSRDAAILEFDFVANSTQVTFDYVFGSEEYPEYVCGNYNDAFGFFVSGSGYANNTNVALIPGTNMSVAINSVNPGVAGANAGGGTCASLAYSQYYFDNTNGLYTQYDGYTVPLRATITTVPCSTYHIKLVVADATDYIYDSMVLLKGRSFKASTDIDIHTIGDKTSFEGCNGPAFVFTNLAGASTDTIEFDIVVTGSATKGVDYDSFPSTITLYPGQITDTLFLNSFLDQSTEGIESIIVTTESACQCNVTRADTLYIKDNGLLTLSASPAADTICQGESVTFQANAGGSLATPYTYFWNTTATTASITVSPNSTTSYYVTVTDSCGQSAVDTVQVVVTPPISATFSMNDAAQCLESNSFNLTNTGTFGNGALFTWSMGDGTQYTTKDVTGHIYANTGTYQIKLAIHDAGCSDSITAQVQVHALAVSMTATDVLCFGDANGGLATSVSGGTPNYSYLWQTGATQSSISNLTAGSYQLTVTDADGCKDTIIGNVNSPQALVTQLAVDDVLCHGDQNGQIAANILGGTPGYTYNWSHGQSTATATSLAPGNYSLTVTDAYGCADTTTATVVQPAALQLSMTPTDLLCHGDQSGAALAQVQGGTLPYGYAWSSGHSSAQAPNLAAGNISVLVTDSNGCTIVDSTVVMEPAPLDHVVTWAAPLCAGDSNGGIAVVVSGGSPAYGYQWQDGATTASRSNLPEGMYQLVVTDLHGCTDTANVALVAPDSLELTAAITDVRCFGEAGGAIDLSVTGGTLPYAFDWHDNVSTEDRTKLLAGNYAVLVTDSNGCQAAMNMVVHEPPLMTLSAQQQNISCFGGSDGWIDLTVTQGQQPLTYAWSNGAATQDIQNLSPGTYQVVVTDSAGCLDSLSVTLTQPSPIQSTTTVTEVRCFGEQNGAIQVLANGGTPGYVYQWSDGFIGPNRSNLAADTFALTITDQLGCLYRDTIMVIQPTPISFAAVIDHPGCSGSPDGNIYVTTSGGRPGYQFLWSNGATTEDNLVVGVGTYTLSVQDSVGCMDTASWTLSIQPSIFASSTVAQVTCNRAQNGEIDVTPVGGSGNLTYAWSDGATTQDRFGLDTGIYHLTITDSVGCQVSLTDTITEPDTLQISLSANDASCFGYANGSASSQIQGGSPGYQYLWSNGQQTPNLGAIPAGWYALTVTDTNGCQIHDSVEVFEPTRLIISANISDASCFGLSDGSIDMAAAGGIPAYQYQWFDGNGSTSRNFPAGQYSVTVTDAQNCMDSGSYQVNQPIQLTIAEQRQHVSCFGYTDGEITLTPAGGTMPYQYSWAQGDTTSTISNLTAGNYAVTVTDSQGCRDSADLLLTSPPALAVAEVHEHISCAGAADGSIDISIQQAGTYGFQWLDGPQSEDRSNLGPGTYMLTITDSAGCETPRQVTIDEPPPLVIGLVAIDPACYQEATGSIQANPSGGRTPYQFLWSDLSVLQHRSALMAGSYAVTLTDSSGCEATAQVTLTDPDSLALIGVITAVSCADAGDGEIQLTSIGGTPGYGYSWHDGDTSGHRFDLVPGEYTVTTVDQQGCEAQGQYLMTEPAPLLLVLDPTQVSCFGEGDGSVSAQVFGGTPPYVYAWNTGTASENIQNLVPGTYDLTVTDANGCISVELVTITQPDSFSVDAGPDHVIGLGTSAVLQGYATGGPHAYSWSPMYALDTSMILEPIASPRTSTTYTLFATHLLTGCVQSDTARVMVFHPKPTFMPNAFTPNGDGNNDVFPGELPFGYQVQRLLIFNRWGQLLHDDFTPWDGRWKGVDQPLEAYAFHVVLVHVESGEKSVVGGNVTLLR